MSIQKDVKRLTAPDIRARKGGDPIVMLTSAIVPGFRVDSFWSALGFALILSVVGSLLSHFKSK